MYTKGLHRNSSEFVTGKWKTQCLGLDDGFRLFSNNYGMEVYVYVYIRTSRYMLYSICGKRKEYGKFI